MVKEFSRLVMQLAKLNTKDLKRTYALPHHKEKAVVNKRNAVGSFNENFTIGNVSCLKSETNLTAIGFSFLPSNINSCVFPKQRTPMAGTQRLNFKTFDNGTLGRTCSFKAAQCSNAVHITHLPKLPF
jgi:hypothetical protein